MKPEPNADEVFGLLLGFFGGDGEKAAAWMEAKNPMLGGISAVDMLKLGRGEKLLRWVKEAIKENEMPCPSSEARSPRT